MGSYIGETLLADMDHRSGMRQNPNCRKPYVSRRTIGPISKKGLFITTLGTILYSLLPIGGIQTASPVPLVPPWAACHQVTFCWSQLYSLYFNAYNTKT